MWGKGGTQVYPFIPWLVQGRERKQNPTLTQNLANPTPSQNLWKGMVIVCVLMTARHLGTFFKALFWGLWFYPSNPTIQNPPGIGQVMSWHVRCCPVNWSPMALGNRCQQAPCREEVQEKSWHYNFKSSDKEDFRSYLPNTTFFRGCFLETLKLYAKIEWTNYPFFNFVWQ